MTAKSFSARQMIIPVVQKKNNLKKRENNGLVHNHIKKLNVRNNSNTFIKNFN